MTSSSFFADDPINGTSGAPDKLGRELYATHLVALFERIHAQSESSVLALVGPWGGGKSSILEMTIELMRQRPDWQIAQFNPWTYSDLDAMLFGFFAEISAALPDDSKPAEIRKSIGRLVQRISPMGKLGGLLGVDASDAVNALGRWVAGDVGPTAERQRLAEALRSAKKPILVVVDDLDRLAPSELLLVFKLVRFVGRLPCIYYLLLYDERTLLDILTRTELCGQNEARARDYLEKIVQVRLDLPPLRQGQASDLFWQGIDDLVNSSGISITSSGSRRFVRAYDQCLRERLTTPRAIKRYLAQVDALSIMVGSEVDFVDFALLTFIRAFEPTLYGAIYRMRTELSVEKAEQFGLSEETDNMRRWHEVIGLAGAADRNVEGLIALLGELFLPVAHKGNGKYSWSDVDGIADRKGVGHRDYFDRYFAFGVPEDDLPDAEICEILLNLSGADSANNPLVKKLSLQLITDTERTIRKVSLRRPHETRTVQAIFRWLGQHFGDLSDSMINGSSQRKIAESFAKTLLLENEAILSDILFHALEDSIAGALLRTRLLDSGLNFDLGSTIRENSRRTVLVCESYARFPFLEIPDDMRKLIRVWCRVDKAACHTWLRAQIDSDRWSALDIAGWTIIAQPRNGSMVLTTFPEQEVDALLGLDYLLDKFANEIDCLSTGPYKFETSAKDRRAATLFMLRQIRDRRK